MTNKEGNATVFKTFPTNQKTFSKQTWLIYFYAFFEYDFKNIYQKCQT